MTEQAKQSGKKIYQEPSLRIYGDIRLLTQSANMHSLHSDNNMTAPRKTG